MFENLSDEIENIIEDEGRDLKFKVQDKLTPLNFDCTPSISYDYLFLNEKEEYSFLNSEINKQTSEEFPNLSDSQIYFQKLNEVCTSNFNDLNDSHFFFQMISPNRNLKDVVDFIFSKKLQADQIPPFIEIKLYTNKISDKAPRVFGFIGNANIIYILFYDPFHKIFNKTGKI
mgnify:CR=1 FL=1